LILADKVSSVGIDMSVSVVAINSGLSEIEEAISVLLNSAECGAISNSELSARERDVLKEIASGKIIKEVADTLNISVNTVLTHRKNISAKLGIRSVSGLSVYALMNGIIK
jgi:DNA-binding CsgD family transcriptional regulator